jgi:hypothetical protein
MYFLLIIEIYLKYFLSSSLNSCFDHFFIGCKRTSKKIRSLMIIGGCVNKHYVVVHSGLSENLYMLISVINSHFRGIPSGKSMRLFESILYT